MFLLSLPQRELPNLFFRTAGRVILLIAYGIDAKSKDDPHIQTAERGLQAVAFGAHIRGQLFDFFPLC